MKLYELISFDSKTSRNTPDHYTDKLSKMGAERLGKGAFGAAYDTKSDKRLGQVTKIGRAGIHGSPWKAIKKAEDDGYLAYLKAVFESKSDNPYFPRFNDLIVRTDPETGKVSYRVNLQRLVNFSSPKIHENEDLMTSIYDYMFVRRDAYFNSYNAADAIERTIYRSLNSQNFNIIKDSEMTEALEFILAIRKNHGDLVVDLHSQNMMWRITGTRPQLVFTDPLA